MSASVTPISGRAEPQALDRVVLQFGDRVLRGFADRHAWERRTNLEQEFGHLPFQLLGSERLEETSLQGLKAAFFVKRFDGPGLDEIRFHDHVSPMTSLWVRVGFRDGEVIEGLVENGASFFLQAGFFLTPTDPEANHWLIYVAKEQVRDFQVLGLRLAPKH